MDTRISPHIRGKGKKNVKHLECGGNTKEHLEMRLFNSRAQSTQAHAARGLSVGEGEGVQGAKEAQEAETKSRVGQCRKLHQEAKCGRQTTCLLLLIKQGHTTERFQLFSKCLFIHCVQTVLLIF